MVSLQIWQNERLIFTSSFFKKYILLTFKLKKVHIRIAITFMKMLNLENYTGIQIVLFLTKLKQP